AGLAVGDLWELRHAYGLLDAEPYAAGIYVGGTVPIPMRAVAPPSDWTVSTAQPLPTLGPRFAAFLVRQTGRVALTQVARASAFVRRAEPVSQPYVAGLVQQLARAAALTSDGTGFADGDSWADGLTAAPAATLLQAGRFQ